MDETASAGETGPEYSPAGRPQVPAPFRPPGMIGASGELRRLLDLAALAASVDLPLFIYGESGTGKDMLARAIHQASARAAGTFLAVNAAALPDDTIGGERPDAAPGPGPQCPTLLHCLMLAQGGTIYLDDICRMPRAPQARLAQFVRRPVLVLAGGHEIAWEGRIIAASNADPRQEIREGRFRRDLYDLLAASYLFVPPLRDRDADAAEIAATHFPRILADLGHPPQELPPRLLAQLRRLPWPGNVRQLLNTLRRMALTPEAARGLPPELPEDVRADTRASAPESPALSFAEIERRAIISAIERNNGSVPRAAEQLRLAASTIYRKLKEWNS